MAVSTLECPNCAAPLDVPPDRTQFFCRFCGATVVVPQSSAAFDSEERDEDAALEPAPDLSRFTVEKSGDRLRIKWSWRSCVTIFVLPFGVVFFCFSLFWMGGVAAMGESLFALFGLPFVCVGAGLLYFGIAMLVNSTTITVEGGRLSVEHGPLPWKAPDPIDSADIQQLYVEERAHHSKNGTNYTYEVQVLSRSGGKTKLVTEYKADDARAVERMIEVHLGIEDRAVRGEHV